MFYLGVLFKLPNQLALACSSIAFDESSCARRSSTTRLSLPISDLASLRIRSLAMRSESTRLHASDALVALSTAENIEKTMADISKNFPKGLEYRIVYNPTVFVQQAIDET